MLKRISPRHGCLGLSSLIPNTWGLGTQAARYWHEISDYNNDVHLPKNGETMETTSARLFTCWGVACDCDRGGAQAQTYPNRPITFVVPFGPGGISDVPAPFGGGDAGTGRPADRGRERPGASGITGASFVARQSPMATLLSMHSPMQNLHYLPVPMTRSTISPWSA